MRTLLITVMLASYSSSLKEPNFPTGKKNSYFFLNSDGSYKYGYNTNRNSFAHENSDRNNEVVELYAYKDNNGDDFNNKYTSAVNGFVPEGEYIFSVNNPDGSYAFQFTANDQIRQVSDNQGFYLYNNDAGTQDLSYLVGPEVGFQAISGSLSSPNGLQSQINRYSNPSIVSNQYGNTEIITGSINDQTYKDDAQQLDKSLRNQYSYISDQNQELLTGVEIGTLSKGSVTAAQYFQIEPKSHERKYETNKILYNNNYYYPSKSQSKYGYIYEY